MADTKITAMANEQDHSQPASAKTLCDPLNAHTKAAPPELKKLRFIDCLRGLAILMVIVVHHGQSYRELSFLQSITSYGQLGVQLFFVASAFTLCLSASMRRDERHPIRNFYIRRIFRIAPLYYIGIVVYFSVSFVMAQYTDDNSFQLYTPKNVLLNITFLHSFSQTAYNDIVPGGWSIGTEMAFYFIFPALFSVCSKSMRDASKPTLYFWPMAAIIFNIFAQILLQQFFAISLTNNGFLYCSILNQIPVFLIGISAYFSISRERVESSGIAHVAWFSAFSLLSYIILHWNLRSFPQNLLFSVLPATSAMSFVYLLKIVRSNPWISSQRFLVRCGQLSYSMYICHFLFAWTVTRAMIKLSHLGPDLMVFLYVPTLILTVGASYIAASISERWIEKPFVKLGKALIRRLDRALPSAGNARGL